MTERQELPLRIDDTPDGLVVRALCGAESGVVAAPELHPGIGRAKVDGSPAALMRMLLHAKSCRECQYRRLEIRARESVPN